MGYFLQATTLTQKIDSRKILRGQCSSNWLASIHVYSWPRTGLECPFLFDSLHDILCPIIFVVSLCSMCQVWFWEYENKNCYWSNVFTLLVEQWNKVTIPRNFISFSINSNVKCFVGIDINLLCGHKFESGSELNSVQHSWCFSDVFMLDIYVHSLSNLEKSLNIFFLNQVTGSWFNNAIRLEIYKLVQFNT